MGGNVGGQSGADAFLQIILDYGVRISVQNKGCWSRLPSRPADADLRTSIQLGESAHPAATVCVADARAAPGRATPILPRPWLGSGSLAAGFRVGPGAAERQEQKAPHSSAGSRRFSQRRAPLWCSEGSVSAPCRRGPEQKAAGWCETRRTCGAQLPLE